MVRRAAGERFAPRGIVSRHWPRGATLLTGIAFVLTPASGAWAQETPEDRLARLLDNRDQLTITIQLADPDQAVPPIPVTNPKTTWMVSRPVQVIVYITNPTSAAVEIPDPYDSRAGAPDVCTKTGLFPDGSINWRCAIEGDSDSGAHVDVPSRFIKPSQTLVVRHKSMEVNPDESFWLPNGGLPRTEGHYMLAHLGDVLEFDTAAPVFVTSALVPLHAQRTYVDSVTGEAATNNMYMVVFAVNDNGWPTICWSTENVEGPVDWPVDAQGKLDSSAWNTLMPIGAYALPI
jgi:hypothetical protein